MPEIHYADPLLYSLSRFSYARLSHRRGHMGTDVDQPRNLAKSVTVE